MTDGCSHKYQFQGVVYRDAEYSRPGGSARNRSYFDRYFCERCLDTVDRNERIVGTSFDRPVQGSMPA